MAGYQTVTKYLREGNRLCSQAGIPLDSETTKRVKEIYEKCNAILVNQELQYTPLSYASYLGLDGMVSGFLECARQTNKNLHNGNVGEFQEFVEYRNSQGDTALHIAARAYDWGIVRLLLAESSWDSLTAKNRDGKTPLSYLNDLPEYYDKDIFAALEAVKRAEVDTRGATVISIDDEQEASELIDYNETTMEQTTYKLSDKHTSLEKLDLGELELSPDKNTILHIAATLGDVKCVKDILQRHPSLIERRNLEGETPAYVASREGHWEIIAIFIGHLKRKEIDIVKPMTRSKDNETALLTAIRNHHAVVVFFFLTKEVPTLANLINDFEESALYIAALKGYDGILELMLKKCIDIAYGGPNGETALHAAAFSNSTDCIKHLLKSKSGLIYAQDARGWTPLHVAASRGHLFLVEYFIVKYPGCQEITCSKGRNVFHIAVENEQSELIKFMFEEKLLTSRLMNQKDSDGNTPIHLLVASNLEMPFIVVDRKVDLSAINNKKQTPLNMISSKAKFNKPSRESFSVLTRGNPDVDEAQKTFAITDNIVLVATLIATASFTAAFTVPGGFDGNEGSKQGMPILLRRATFQAFVFSNALSFSCSCAVLFGHIKLLIDRYEIEEADRKYVQRAQKRLNLMYCLIFIAMVMMAVSFVTGIFVVLTPSLGLAISLCVTCTIIMVSSLVFGSILSEFLTYMLDFIEMVFRRMQSRIIPSPSAVIH